MSDTRRKLERLFASSPGRNDSLGKLEREVFGDTETGTDKDPTGATLSLKERLERLVAVAAAGRKDRSPREAPTKEPGRRVTPLEEALDGREIAHRGGSFYCVERYLDVDHHHGRMSLSRIADVPPQAFDLLAHGNLESEIALERALFVDTETTGLAGGSGTYAFLIGLGFVEDGAFVVRQLFMRDYREEKVMLAFLAEELRRFDVLVTYNGKSFDVPLLESRFVLARQAFDFSRLVHFDLLHPARSLWKARFESCRLAELEYMLLGLEREEDVPGHLIPDIYFRYVRTGDAGKLRHVFRHNHDDILSLAALTVAASDMLDESSTPDDPIDDFSLGRLFERAGDPERSERHYSRAVASGLEGGARRRSLRGLADLYKRRGEWDEARRLWRELAAEEGAAGLHALKELAMDAEHRERDFDAARAHCDEALARLQTGLELELPPGARVRWREDLEHRRRRLKRRRVTGAGAEQNAAGALWDPSS